MKAIKGSQTEKNLLKSFAGESQARMRYDYFASKAKKEGYEQIAAIFSETALNEKEHAKRFFKFLSGGNIEITASYPAGKIGDTLENLKASYEGEKEEWSELYPEFARVAKDEGYNEVAKAFLMIADAEKAHDERFRKFYENIQKDEVFKKDKVVTWKCRNCGYTHTGEEAVDLCPACLHSKAYFEVKNINY